MRDSDEKFERVLVRVEGADIIDTGHGGIGIGATFVRPGSGQGLGYTVDAEFIKGFMGVFGVERLRDTNGRKCWITRCHTRIKKIEPALEDEGKPFDIEKWGERADARYAALKAAKLVGRDA